MVLLQYLKPVNTLPDPRGSLAMKVAPRKIAETDSLGSENLQEEACVGAKRGFIHVASIAIPFMSQSLSMLTKTHLQHHKVCSKQLDCST